MSTVARDNAWTLLVHSHVPIDRALADLTPLINAAKARADVEHVELRAKVARVEALAREWIGDPHDCRDFTAPCDDACQFARELLEALDDGGSESLSRYVDADESQNAELRARITPWVE